MHRKENVWVAVGGSCSVRLVETFRRPQQQEARVETAPVQGTATSPALPGLPPPPVAEEPAKPVAPKPAASAGHRRRHAEPKKIGDALIDPYGL